MEYASRVCDGRAALTVGMRLCGGNGLHPWQALGRPCATFIYVFIYTFIFQFIHIYVVHIHVVYIYMLYINVIYIR